MSPTLDAESGASIGVVVAFSAKPRQVSQVALRLPAGSTVQEALQASGASQEMLNAAMVHRPVGVWGRPATLNQPLRDQDRIELYRPLTVDPKLARRERFKQQGQRAAGLFARRKQGAPPES